MTDGLGFDDPDLMMKEWNKVWDDDIGVYGF
jgi:hypothetical protein